jgi:hypothetical protein
MSVCQRAAILTTLLPIKWGPASTRLVKAATHRIGQRSMARYPAFSQPAEPAARPAGLRLTCWTCCSWQGIRKPRR